MIGLAYGLKVFICTAPADMRRSFDGLSGMAENLMKQDPLAGHLFVFRNRNRDRLKILYWDRDGLAIWGAYLRDILTKLPDQPVASELAALLPDRWLAKSHEHRWEIAEQRKEERLAKAK